MLISARFPFLSGPINLVGNPLSFSDRFQLDRSESALKEISQGAWDRALGHPLFRQSALKGRRIKIPLVLLLNPEPSSSPAEAAPRLFLKNGNGEGVTRIQSEFWKANGIVEKIEFGEWDYFKSEDFSRIIPDLNEKELSHLSLQVAAKLYSHSARTRMAAVIALGAIVSNPLLKADERSMQARRIKDRLKDEDPSVRREAIVALAAIIPHLNFHDRHDSILGIGETLKEHLPDIRHTAMEHLTALSQQLPLRHHALKILKSPEASLEEKQKALVVFAYSHGKSLSPGAMLALILLGKKILKGEAGLLKPLRPGLRDKGLRYRFESLTSRLSEIGNAFREGEILLKGHPTIGGKIRGLIAFTESHGYQSGLMELIHGETPPLLLEPLRDPEILVHTVTELTYLEKRESPLPFKLSITLSGEIGDDLRLAALGLHAFLRKPYPFPKKIPSNVDFQWFAPIVEGGGVFKDLNGVFTGERERIDGRKRRYDHFFLGFERPPKAGYFEKAGRDDPWSAAKREFIAVVVPRIKNIDVKNKNIRISLTGIDQDYLWFPSLSDWKAMTRRVQDPYGDNFRVEIEIDPFQNRLFLEFARQDFHRELSEVIESAWVLSMLREVKRKGVSADTGGNLLKSVTEPDLKKLADLFEMEMIRLIREAGIAHILKTPWVGNKDWPSIRDDMQVYQKALEKPEFKKAIQGLIRKIIQAAKAILIPPLMERGNGRED